MSMVKPRQRQSLKQLYARRDLFDNLIELVQAYAPVARHGHLVKTASASSSPAAVAPAVETRALIVSPEPVVCEGFRSLTASSPLRLVAACSSVAQALEHLEAARPDVAIVHLNSPGALDEIPPLRKRAPDCALALWVDKVSTDMVSRAVKMGARGILPTILPSGQVLEALLAIAQGEMRINLPAKVCSPREQQVHLSAGQKRLVSLIGQGLKNKEIATLTGSTEGTVKTSLNRLFKVLGAKDRFDVALYALQTQPAGDLLAGAPVFRGITEEPSAGVTAPGPTAL